MAEVLLSPGVLARENDQSFLQAQPVQAGSAIIGPTVKGPVGIPTLVTTYSQYQNKFGAVVESGSAEYTYFTSISAYNYFQQGGDSLLVTRVVSGSYTSATSSNIPNSNVNSAGTGATASIDVGAMNLGNSEGIRLVTAGGTVNIFVSSSTGFPDYPGINTFSYTGGVSGLVTEINNSASAYFTASEAGGVLALTSSIIPGNDTQIFSGSFYNLIGSGGTNTGITLSGGTASTFNNAFTLETLSEGTNQNSTSALGSAGQLADGTVDNIRWEVVSPDTASGTFSLLIRRGDDITNSKTILETWGNISLDPNANNYIEKVIGNTKQTVATDSSTGESYIKNDGTYNTLSSYVRVKSVNSKTLNYFDNAGNAKAAFTSSIPVASEGTFGDAAGAPFVGMEAKFYGDISDTNTQGFDSAALGDTTTNGTYAVALNLLANQDLFQYNLITAPGLVKANTTATGELTTMVNTAQTRGDNLAIVDLVNYDTTTLATVTAGASAIDSSYAATYWPWLQTLDPDLGGQVWVPASTMIPGVYAFNDRAGEPWFAPAGLNRGGLSTVLRAERNLTNGNRNTLYQAGVNPIATFPNTGVVVFGQKTLQKKASALDRVNVRRLLIELKSYISQVADNLVFEQNTIATRNNFLTQVNPYLESVQQRQGLFAFKVVMDDSNNTPDVIDRNELVGQIYIQPTKTAEFIYLDFNVLPTGATFPA